MSLSPNTFHFSLNGDSTAQGHQLTFSECLREKGAFFYQIKGLKRQKQFLYLYQLQRAKIVFWTEVNLAVKSMQKRVTSQFACVHQHISICAPTRIFKKRTEKNLPPFYENPLLGHPDTISTHRRWGLCSKAQTAGMQRRQQCQNYPEKTLKLGQSTAFIWWMGICFHPVFQPKLAPTTACNFLNKQTNNIQHHCFVEKGSDGGVSGYPGNQFICMYV